MGSNEERRPETARTALKVNRDEDSTIVTAIADVPRCATCGHRIWSPESIRTGIGRECRRQAVNAWPA